jgi:hypothetical protein
MTRLQRFFTTVFPARWAASMEAESRSWIMLCDGCGHGESVWDRGGIRWKAAGKPRIFGRCPKCGQRIWHTVTKDRTRL